MIVVLKPPVLASAMSSGKLESMSHTKDYKQGRQCIVASCQNEPAHSKGDEVNYSGNLELVGNIRSQVVEEDSRIEDRICAVGDAVHDC